jgi:short subunit dehydrogenase-like uncharacterized protein
MAPVERYDIVLVGATGVTGRQAAERLARRAGGGPPLRWAIASRDRERLERVRATLPDGVGVITADVRDPGSMRDLVASTRVVVNMVGPYSLYGEPLLGACARAGVDYVDITGEPAHVRRMIDRHHDSAVRSGAKIVPFCGFDSVPSDIGTLLIVEHFRARGLPTREVKGFFRASGRLNPGTVATVVELWNRQEDVRAMRDPLLLNPPGHRAMEDRLRNPDPMAPVRDRDLGRWVAPFFMGPINTRVVRRSRALSADWHQDYGRAFRYQEYWDPGGSASWLTASGMSWAFAVSQLMAVTPGAGTLFAPAARRAEDWPDEMMEEGCHFRALFAGTAADGTRVWAEFSGRGDPSNGATVAIVCECALALALDRHRLPGGPARAGLLTPATAFGLELVERLRAVGMSLECPTRPS